MRTEAIRAVFRMVRGAGSHAVFWVLAGAAAVFGLFGVLLPLLPATQLTVRTQVATSLAATMEVYVNQLEAPLGTVALAPGVATTNVVTVPTGGVELIQLNISGPVGQAVRVYSVQVLNGKRVVASSAPDLSGWDLAYLYPRKQSQKPSPTGVPVLVTTEQTGAMREYLNVPGPSYLPGQAQAKDPLHRLSLSFWIGSGLSLLAWASTRRRRALAGLVALSGVGAVECLFAVTRHTGGLTAPTRAVGRAAYLGLSVSSNLHAIEAMYLLCGVFGVCAGLGWDRLGWPLQWLRNRRRRNRWQRKRRQRKRRQQRPRGRAVVPAQVRHPPGRWRLDNALRPSAAAGPGRSGGRSQAGWARLADVAAVASLLVAAMAVFTPDILANLRSAAENNYVPGFDGDNGLAWTVFAERGLVPMKDFWYPYGNALFLVAHPIAGAVLEALVNLALLCGFGWVFWQLSSHRKWVTWLAVIALLLAEQFMPEFSRYSVGYLVPLLYWSIPSAPSSRRWPGRAALALAVGGGLFIEPDPIFYGLIGLALSLGLELAIEYRKLRQVTREIGQNLAAAVALALVYLLYTAVQGQLGGLWDVYGQTGAITAYTATPTVLVTNLRSALGLDGIVIWAPSVIMGAGVFLRLRSCRRDLPVSRLLVALAGCGFLLIEKDSVRAIPEQLRITLLLAALVVLVASTALREEDRGVPPGVWARLRSLAYGGCVGALAAAIAGSAGIGVLRAGFDGLGTTVRDDLHVALHLPAMRPLESQALSDARFADYQGELQVAASIERLVGHSGYGLFVLGDDPSLYVILDQHPPWTITAYNSSPISDQRRVVDWLARHKPPVVVFDEATPSFDDVPSDVRTPLVYQAVIKAYVPMAQVGSYEVLRRRRPGEGPSAGFWSAQLGTEVDLGFLPDAMPATEPKNAHGVPEVPYLRLELTGTGPRAATISVPVQFGSVVTEVLLDVSPGRTEFSIPLSRIWAWSLSDRPRLAGAVSDAAWSAQIAFGQLPTRTLY